MKIEVTPEAIRRARKVVPPELLESFDRAVSRRLWMVAGEIINVAWVDEQPESQMTVTESERQATSDPRNKSGGIERKGNHRQQEVSR